MKTIFLLRLVLALFLVANFNSMLAHCDTEDGPVIADAKKAIEQNNVNYALKWIPADHEKELTELFNLVMKVRGNSPEARELADRYFFETLVRIHRSSEGVPYTGVKPAGTPIDEKILAADRSIVSGDLSPLKNFVGEDRMPELIERFEKTLALKNFDVNNVQAGREYVAAYVSYFHYAEGEETHAHEHSGNGNHAAHIPWILSGFFFLSTLVFGILYIKKK